MWGFLQGMVSAPVGAVRTFYLFSKIIPQNFTATIIATSFFAFYVPVVVAFLYFGFEKTQSLEIIYFFAFLIGCLFEVSRLLVPIDSLWRTTSSPLLVIGRIVIAGRVLAPIGLLFASLFSSNDQRQNVERNFVIMVVIAILVGKLFPLNTMKTTTTCTVQWGYTKLFSTLRFCILFVTVLTLFISSYRNNSPEFKNESVGCLSLESGYYFLCAADNYVFLILGSILLTLGTFLYLRAIHSIYLWR